MFKKKILIGIVALLAVVLAACGGNEGTAPDNGTDTENDSTENTETKEETQSEGESDFMEETDHSGMNHSSTGEVPEDLADAEDPTYPVGSEALITTNHMGGMEGAFATIDGAYDTTVHTVTYTPTTGGEKVEDHKWVIHEEIE